MLRHRISVSGILAWRGDSVKSPEHRVIYKGITLEDGTAVAAHCGWRFPAHRAHGHHRKRAPGFSVYLSRFTDKSELVCVTPAANKGGVDLTEPLARRTQVSLMDVSVLRWIRG
ncbi:MAG: hypothetical protein U1D30_09740 [Planctomycetota bacterium]